MRVEDAYRLEETDFMAPGGNPNRGQFQIFEGQNLTEHFSMRKFEVGD